MTNLQVLVGAPKASKCFGEDQATMVLMDTPGDIHTSGCSTVNSTKKLKTLIPEIGQKLS